MTVGGRDGDLDGSVGPVPSAGAGEGAVPGRVVVVGPCASGKSTLVGGLRGLGYDAVAVGQEHSEIASLWRRSRPAALLVLDVDLSTIRDRRGPGWSEPMYDAQRRRLAAATDAATVVLPAGRLSRMGLLAAATAALREAGVRPVRPAGQDDGASPR